MPTLWWLLPRDACRCFGVYGFLLVFICFLNRPFFFFLFFFQLSRRSFSTIDLYFMYDILSVVCFSSLLLYWDILVIIPGVPWYSGSVLHYHRSSDGLAAQQLRGVTRTTVLPPLIYEQNDAVSL